MCATTGPRARPRPRTSRTHRRSRCSSRAGRHRRRCGSSAPSTSPPPCRGSAKVLGYRVIVCDAREIFATRRRFPAADEVVVSWPGPLFEQRGAQLGSRDAVCILTHDPKFDVPAVQGALATKVGYIGVMGSRRTHDKRMERLREVGRHRRRPGAADVADRPGRSAPARRKRRPSRSVPRSSPGEPAEGTLAARRRRPHPRLKSSRWRSAVASAAGAALDRDDRPRRCARCTARGRSLGRRPATSSRGPGTAPGRRPVRWSRHAGADGADLGAALALQLEPGLRPRVRGETGAVEALTGLAGVAPVRHAQLRSALPAGPAGARGRRRCHAACMVAGSISSRAAMVVAMRSRACVDRPSSSRRRGW